MFGVTRILFYEKWYPVKTNMKEVTRMRFVCDKRMMMKKREEALGQDSDWKKSASDRDDWRNKC